MNQNYNKAIAFSLANVGEYSNHINNKGGITYLGIRKPYTSHFKGWEIIEKKLEQYPELKSPYKNKPTRLLKFNDELRKDTQLKEFVQEFYEQYYWKKIGADRVSDLSYKASIIFFDISVTQGVKRALRTISQLLTRMYNSPIQTKTEFDETLIEEIAKALEKGEDLFVANLLQEYLDNLVELSKYEGGHNLSQYVERIINLRNYLRLL